MFGNDDIFFPSQIRLCCWWLTYISQEISLLGCKLPLLLWQMKVLFFRDPQGKTYENWSFILALGLGDPYDSFPRYRLLCPKVLTVLVTWSIPRNNPPGKRWNICHKKGKAGKNHLIIDWKVPFLGGGYMWSFPGKVLTLFWKICNFGPWISSFIGPIPRATTPPSGRLTKKTCPQPTKSVCFARFSLWGEGRCL